MHSSVKSIEVCMLSIKKTKIVVHFRVISTSIYLFYLLQHFVMACGVDCAKEDETKCSCWQRRLLLGS